MQHENERNNDKDNEGNKESALEIVVDDVSSADDQKQRKHQSQNEDHPKGVLVPRDEEEGNSEVEAKDPNSDTRITETTIAGTGT